jgi:ABC-type transport system involved in multi-copper enzyme maturation permease subunit
MSDWWAACRAGMRLQTQQFMKGPLLIVLTVVEALTFLALVSLFGLTGSKAPTALVVNDHSPLTASFVQDLAKDHDSFRLEPTTLAIAKQRLAAGSVVDILTIPKGFGASVAAGRTVVLPVTIDNVDTDLTDDIQRALPAAIQTFGLQHHFNGIRLAPVEHDLLSYDTAYVPYLVVSALGLDALVVAGALGATAMAGEWENKTLVQWRLSPSPMSGLLIGKLIAVVIVSTLAVWVAALLVFFGYGVHPHDAVGTLAALALCCVIFTALGAVVGNLLRRTLPVAIVFFGIALPLYIDSGSLEPERFDGHWLWFFGHATPVYAAVGVLQNTVHGLRVTPESIPVDLGILTLWALFSMAIAYLILQRSKAVR